MLFGVFMLASFITLQNIIIDLIDRIGVGTEIALVILIVIGLVLGWEKISRTTNHRTTSLSQAEQALREDLMRILENERSQRIQLEQKVNELEDEILVLRTRIQALEHENRILREREDTGG